MARSVVSIGDGAFIEDPIAEVGDLFSAKCVSEYHCHIVRLTCATRRSVAKTICVLVFGFSTETISADEMTEISSLSPKSNTDYLFADRYNDDYVSDSERAYLQSHYDSLSQADFMSRKNTAEGRVSDVNSTFD
eukprot:gene24339-31671_t